MSTLTLDIDQIEVPRSFNPFLELNDELSACIAHAGDVKPTFILGPPRSGTTLLAQILARGDGVLSLSEPFLAGRTLRPRVSRMLFQILRTYFHWSERVPSTTCPVELFGFLRNCALHKDQRLLIKEVFNGLDPSDPHSDSNITNSIIASGAPIIAIARDPYDTVASTVKVVNHYLSGWRRGLHVLACRFVPRFEDEEAIARHAAVNWARFANWVRRDQPILVRYEDLICDTAREVRRVCASVGFPFTDKMLIRGRRPPTFGGLGDIKVVLWPCKSIHRRAVGCGCGLSPALREIVRQFCGESAAELGYAS